jgi:hypothetical protein
MSSRIHESDVLSPAFWLWKSDTLMLNRAARARIQESDR